MIYSTIYDAGNLRAEFIACDRDYYSFEGYAAMIELFADDNVELDVIGFSSDLNEEDFMEIAENYRVDLSECSDDAERITVVEKYLSDNTWSQATTSGCFIYQAF